MTKQWTTKYGTYTHVKFITSSEWGRTVYRIDDYVSNDEGYTGTDRFFAAGTKDFSPAHDNGLYHENYNSDCGCCYLGFPHTEELHQQRINQ